MRAVSKNFDQGERFRLPEFQKKLERARKFQRKSSPLPDSFWSRFLARIGLGSVFARALMLLLLLASFYFLTISDMFLVKEAVLLSQGPPRQQLNAALKSLSRRRVYAVPKNHILIFNRNDALSAFQEEFPQIKRIDFYKRILPNKIEISLTERQPQYIWQSGANFYFLDQDGVAFQQIINYEPAAYQESLIVDRSGAPVSLGEELQSAAFLIFLRNLKEFWPRHIFDLGFIAFKLPTPKSPDLAALTTLGFTIYFDAGRDAETQVKNLAFVLYKEIKSETLPGLSYIDLRLPALAYYCYKDAPCALENESGQTP